jgi:ribosomal 50S subunit-associated protein YjgA (DUF615 family)
MSLEKEKDPVSSFINCGESYLTKPGVISGIALDDAAVVLKRHLLSIQDDHALIDRLNALGKSIRSQDLDTIRAVYDQVVATLKSE